jgi:Protein of unknown function
MNRDEAAEILEYLLEAACELDEAKAAAAVLEDRDKDAATLKEFIIKLNSELLQTIYERFGHERFGDLIPFKEFPEINSSLRWDQVQLPPSASESQVDQILLSVIVPQWHKMARIIWDAVKRSEELALGITDEMFAARVQVLVEADRLEGQGDLRKWRHSEVRLKAEIASLRNYN